MSVFRKSANIPAATTTSMGVYGAGIYPLGNLVLNGPIVSPNGTVSFINNGYVSSVSITSAGNISTTIFIVVGKGNNGALISETIVGPNANSVFTDNLFETVNSISINGLPPALAFDIGSNNDVAVKLNSYNTGAANNVNVNYSMLVNSLTAAGQWVAGGLILYGVTTNTPTLLTRTKLAHATRANTYFALNNAAAATTQANLNDGVITQTTYPFAGVVVAILNGVNTTPAFVEITQS